MLKLEALFTTLIDGHWCSSSCSCHLHVGSFRYNTRTYALRDIYRYLYQTNMPTKAVWYMRSLGMYTIESILWDNQLKPVFMIIAPHLE